MLVCIYLRLGAILPTDISEAADADDADIPGGAADDAGSVDAGDAADADEGFGYDVPGGESDGGGGVDPPVAGLLPSPPLLERLKQMDVDDPGYQLLDVDDDGGVPGDFDDSEPEAEEDGGEWAAHSESQGPGAPLSPEHDTTHSGHDPNAPVSFDAAPEEKRLERLHVGLGGKTLEGGKEFCTYNTKAKGSPFFPYENLSVMLLFLFVHKYQVSEAMLDGLLAILRTRHDDKGFEVDDLKSVTAKHFYSRRRSHHPLLEVVETMVPTKDRGTSVPSFTIPVNLLLARKMQSPRFIEMCVENAGGKVLSAEEAQQNRLSSPHLFAVPTEPLGNALSTNMHGALARSSAYFGFDGLLGARNGGRKVFINDVAMCTIGGRVLPCRLLQVFWDEAEEALLMSVRRFRSIKEVRGVEGPERHRGLMRVWEEEGSKSAVILHNSALEGACEIYTRGEASRSEHRKEPRAAEERWGEEDAYIGEGFVMRRPKRGRDEDNGRQTPPFAVSKTQWWHEGSRESPLFGIRYEGFRENFKNLVFASLPLIVYNDGFNAYSMNCQVRRIRSPHPLLSPCILPGFMLRTFL